MIAIIFFTPALQEKLLQAYEKAANVGDCEHKIRSLVIYSAITLYACGDSLLKLHKEIQTFIRRALQHKQGLVAKFLVNHLSLVIQLMNVKEDLYAKYFQCSEDDFLNEANDKTGFGM